MRRLLLALVVVLLTWPAVATALPPPSSFEVAVLIKQLGSPSFQEREAAGKRLEGMGERALPALQKAAKEATDAEVRRRAQQIAEAWLVQLGARERDDPNRLGLAAQPCALADFDPRAASRDHRAQVAEHPAEPQALEQRDHQHCGKKKDGGLLERMHGVIRER